MDTYLNGPARPHAPRCQYLTTVARAMGRFYRDEEYGWL